MTAVCCTSCHNKYPATGLPFLCPDCGGIWDQADLPAFDLGSVENLPGIWRYRHTFSLDPSRQPVTLGEGATPLVRDCWEGKTIYFKMESLNPTGSYKDRASAVLANHLVERGTTTAVEDSSGNAGASFAAYAARSGVKARIFVPASASGPKRRQIEMYGAELVPIEGPRSAAAQAVRHEADRGVAYASHAYLPFGMDGIATIAYEIFESLGAAPGSVVCPAGHGSFLLGIARGFQALKKSGAAAGMPALVAVQAAACAPMLAAIRGETGNIPEEVTIAEGVRVRTPVRSEALLAEIWASSGEVVAVAEKEILPARDELAGRGFYVEPTSAIAWAAFKQLAARLPEPVVLLLSGTGFKYNSNNS